jgi:hypothetical protein
MRLELKKAQRQLKQGENVIEALPIVINDQIGSYYKYSLIKFAYEFLVFSERTKEHVKDECYENLKQEVIDIVRKGILEDFIDNQKITQDIHVIRETIAKGLELLTIYADEIEMYEYILNRIEYRFKTNYSNSDIEAFSGEVIQFLFSDKDNALINQKVKAVLGQLPMRLTKDKFFDYVKSSLNIYKGTDKQHLVEHIEVLKKICTPEINGDFGKVFVDVYEPIKNIQEMTFDQITEEAFKSAKNNLKVASNKIENYINSYVDLILNVNLIYAQLISKDKKDIYNQEHAFNIISKTIKYWDTEEDGLEEIMEDLEALEGIQENIGHDILMNEGIIETGCHFLNEIPVPIQGDLMRLDQLGKLTSSSFYTNLIEEHKEPDILDDKKIYKLMEELFNYLEENFKNQPMIIRRSKMSKLMATLPLSFNRPEEIYQYIHFALTQCGNEAEREASIKLIKEIMEDYE